MPKIGTVIICRNNAPLIKCLFDLIKSGRRIKARIAGRDIAAKFKDTVGEVLEKRRNCSIGEFLILLDAWISKLRIRHKDKEADEELLADYEDRYSCIRVMSQWVDDARGLYTLIDEYIVSEDDLTDDPNVVVLTTSHRVKGLEFGRAVVIRRDLMPNSNCKRPEDIAQEEHLIYVAFTRGMEALWVCNDNQPE